MSNNNVLNKINLTQLLIVTTGRTDSSRGDLQVYSKRCDADNLYHNLENNKRVEGLLKILVLLLLKVNFRFVCLTFALRRAVEKCI